MHAITTPFSRLRRIALLGAALGMMGFVGIPGAHAQARQAGPRDPAQRVEQRVAALTRQLNLSRDQTAQLRSILGEQQKQMQQLRQNRSEDRQAMREQMTKIRQTTEQRVSAVLTEPQRTRYQEMRKNRESRARSGQRERGRDRNQHPAERDSGR